MVRDSLFSRGEQHGEHHDILKKSGLVFEGHYKRGDRRWAKQLPRARSVLGGAPSGAVKGAARDDVKGLLQGCKRVVVVGVHGWFPVSCSCNDQRQSVLTLENCRALSCELYSENRRAQVPSLGL